MGYTNTDVYFIDGKSIYKFNLNTKEYTSINTYSSGSDSDITFAQDFYLWNYTAGGNGKALGFYNINTNTISWFSTIPWGSFGWGITKYKNYISMTSHNSNTFGVFDSNAGVLHKYTKNNFRGISCKYNKCFINGDLYEFSIQSGVGSLIKSNVIPAIGSGSLIELVVNWYNDFYFHIQNKLYSWDDNTNTATFIRNLDFIDIFTPEYINEFVGLGFGSVRYYFSTFLPDMSDKVLLGYNVCDKHGVFIEGTMPNNGTLNYTPSISQQSIPAGYTSGGTIDAVTMSEEDIENAIAQAEDILD